MLDGAGFANLWQLRGKEEAFDRMAPEEMSWYYISQESFLGSMDIANWYKLGRSSGCCAAYRYASQSPPILEHPLNATQLMRMIVQVTVRIKIL
jgi:hypothetical protein